MLNRIVLIGRLVRDPEQRQTSSGVAVTNFTLAVDRPFKNQQGEREADFVDITAWRKLAEICSRYLAKGRPAAVDGRLQVRSYEDSSGIRRKAVEVVADNVRFLGGNAGEMNRNNMNAGGVPVEVVEDDIPF